MNGTALNQIPRTALGRDPEPADPDKEWLILFPEDHSGYGSDPNGNVAILVDEEQAREVKRLAENAVEDLTGGDGA